jgi:hypothetical protein
VCHSGQNKPSLRPTIIAALTFALSALPALADSHVRIVRLSDVQGTVQINKNSGLGFERAFMNLPITEGSRLRTQENGRAEVEFEDGSSLRLAPNTAVDFSRLSMNDASHRLSTVNLIQGKAYINWLGKSGDEFTLDFSNEKVELKQAAHFRVEDSPGTIELANFKSGLEVEGPSGTIRVDKDRTATFLGNDEQAKVARNVKPDPDDRWDAQSIEYHDQYSKNNPSPYGYGISDLSYYGGYSNVPGYGTLWQPYFTGAAWNPFMDGAWSWYPGMGFMWASAYPWGWMPYYYGNWLYAPGYGWGWQPGSTWNTWHGGLHYVGAVAAGFHAPVPPTGTVKPAIVGRGGALVTKAPDTVVVRAGSAGLDIPRGSYDNLRGINKRVARAKTGTVELRSAPQFAASSMRARVYGFTGMPSPALGQPGHAAGSAGHAAGASAGGGHAR